MKPAANELPRSRNHRRDAPARPSSATGSGSRCRRPGSPNTVALVVSLLALVPAPAAHAQQVGHHLGDLTWTDAEVALREAAVVVLPFGAAAKEHGPHLPMNADFRVMEYLCQRAVEELSVVVAPPIAHGWFPAFRQFPGTEVADPDVFRSYVMLVARSLVEHGARRLVILNTGIATATGLPLATVARELRVQTGVPTLLVSWGDLETEETAELQRSTVDGHAGEVETSIHLYLQPDLVRMDRAVPAIPAEGPRVPGYMPGLFSRDPADPDFSTTGVLGDPTVADAARGERFLAIMSERWLDALRRFAEVPLTRDGGGAAQ